MPLIAIAVMPGERIRDYHFSLRGFFHHLWIYVVLFALRAAGGDRRVDDAVVPPHVSVLSDGESLALRSVDVGGALRRAVPLARDLLPRLLAPGLRRALGANAIFVMIVPYCMIHYGKPMPETLGAIGAGLILGTLAMRTRSIWGGVLIHVGVAMTMDVLALRGCPPMGSNRWCGG